MLFRLQKFAHMNIAWFGQNLARCVLESSKVLFNAFCTLFRQCT